MFQQSFFGDGKFIGVLTIYFGNTGVAVREFDT